MSGDFFEISEDVLSIEAIDAILSGHQKLRLTKEVEQNIQKSRDYLDRKIDNSDAVMYGINTGFGALCNTVISKDELKKLQQNLVISHACGTGNTIPMRVVELLLLLKIKGLSIGNSAISLSTINRLIDFYNNQVTPIVYEQGSLGASGDLAPLAHMSLPLLGKGEVFFNGKRTAGQRLEELFGWKPIDLQPKEGLALLNGTQFMSAFGTYVLLKMSKLQDLGDRIAAMAYEAFLCSMDPMNALIHKVRSHEGQQQTAERFRELLSDSELLKGAAADVQDPYSFRCIPQVHGASKDVIQHAQSVFEREINSVTDNPTIFANEDEVLSAGNFHGQPLALQLDFISIAIAELCSISERRIYKLISGNRGLPAFLTANPGLNSGFMIPQYTAASIVSQNKQLCSPSSVDTIDSSNGQEDHVSMGGNAATKAFRVLENYEKVLGIELMNAAQAIGFRDTELISSSSKELLNSFRKDVPFVETDEEMDGLINKSLNYIKVNSSI